MNPVDKTAASIALNRFGLGARPEEPAPADPRAWIEAQFARYDPRPAPVAALAPATQIIGELADYRQQVRAMRSERRMQAADPASGTPVPAPTTAPTTTAATAVTTVPPSARTVDPDVRAGRRQLRTHYDEAVAARIATSLETPAPFVERMVHFWSNHFAVSAQKIDVTPLAGAYEVEAIRPHVLGRFADLLRAAEHHPAMLLYLDQAQSVGPDSRVTQRPAAAARRRGLNENLAREIMELHTLGARTGYSQADVTEFARALTGWTVAGLGPGAGAAPAGFRFAPGQHEPGARTILGRSYADAGEAQGQAVLDDLARHPATATHIATKLARHFAGDVPPPAMVARLTAAFRASDGDLPTLYRAIVASPEAWVPGSAKFRTPWEWSIGAMRAVGMRAPGQGMGQGLLNQLGQPVWRPAQPNGYDDIAASWAGPDALMRRVEAAERLAARTAAIDARALAATLYPGALSAATAQAIARAESPGQALALLLVAPEAMRR